MDFILKVLSLTFSVLVLTRLLIELANFTGEKFGTGNAFIKLCSVIAGLVKRR